VPLDDGRSGARGARGPALDLGRLVELGRADWGRCHTNERNLGRARELAVAEPPDGAAHDPVAAIDAIRAAIDAAPKTTGWKLRARVGERVAWYQTPEEVRHEA
jgi:hypothetical protein